MRQALFHEAPREGDEVALRHVGPPHEGGVRHFIYQDVLDELDFAARYHHGAPQFALLTGQLGVEARGPFLEVSGFEGLNLEVASSDDPALWVEALLGAMKQALDDSGAARVGGELPVGLWVHRPNSAGELDALVACVHLSLFNVPFQLVMVMDTLADALACYARAPRMRFSQVGFALVSRRLEGAAVPAVEAAAIVAGDEAAMQPELVRPAPDDEGAVQDALDDELMPGDPLGDVAPA